MVLNRVLRVWEWYAGRSEVCVRPLDRSFTSQLILMGGCSCWLPSATSSPSSPCSCSRSSSVRPQEAWLMLQQFWVSTGGSMEFSTGPVLGRLRHRHPDSRLGLEGPDSSTLCCRGPITRNYCKQKGENTRVFYEPEKYCKNVFFYEPELASWTCASYFCLLYCSL